MKNISEPLYKPGDFRRAIDSTNNYSQKKRKEIKISSDDLRLCESSEEKWELLEQMVYFTQSLNL